MKTRFSYEDYIEFAMLDTLVAFSILTSNSKCLIRESLMLELTMVKQTHKVMFLHEKLTPTTADEAKFAVNGCNEVVIVDVENVLLLETSEKYAFKSTWQSNN